MRKPKKPQSKQPSGRDLFQTPNYATDILIPFIPKGNVIWECAAGKGKIANRLRAYGFTVRTTDIDMGIDFLTQNVKSDCIITNPPYSLKKEFVLRAVELGRPFAFLIPADYSRWIITAIQLGCEKIIPTRRIDFITPTGLSGASGHTSYYHSMWLTYGFGLGRTETFVELTNEMKKNI